MFTNPRETIHVCPSKYEKEFSVVSESDNNALLNLAEKVIFDEVNSIQMAQNIVQLLEFVASAIISTATLGYLSEYQQTYNIKYFLFMTLQVKMRKGYYCETFKFHTQL